MFTFINGSQKNHYSNSKYFLKYIGNKVNNYIIYDLKNKKYNQIIKSIKSNRNIVLAFPLYVDSPNTITLEFLDYVIDKKIDFKKTNIYIIINCGFREGAHNITALNILKAWCKRVKASYKGSILIGAGEVIGKPYYKFISHKALKDLDYFSERIIKQDNVNDIITTTDLLNNKLYCLIANHSWNKQAKRNHLKKQNILDK